jgi:hypothetical protein
MKAVSCFLFCMLIIFFSAASTQNYTLFEENGKVGLKSDDGHILIPAQYQALGWSNAKLSVVNNVTGYQVNGLWGLINISNHKVTQPMFEEILPGEGSYLIARKKSPLSLRFMQGCITTDGKEVIPFQYDGVHVESLRAIVYTKIGNVYKYGLIDLENKTLIPQQYKEIRALGSLRYAVENFDYKTAVYTESGKQITGFKLDSVSGFKKIYAVFYQNLQQGLIDREGQIRLEAKYREIQIDDAGNVKTRQANEWSILDGQNKLIRQTFADDLEPTGNNQMKISISGTTFLVDQNFLRINHDVYESLQPFTKGKAIFTRNNQQGIIRSDGSVVVQPVFDKLIPEKNFILARKKVQGHDRWTMLDSMGVQKSMKSYDRIVMYNEKYFAVEQRGYWGAMNADGKEVLACAYDSLMGSDIPLSTRSDQYIVVKFKGQFGIVSLSDEWKITPRSNRLVLIDDDHFVEFSIRTTYLKSMAGGVIYFTDNPIQVFSDHLIETLPSGTQWKINLEGRIVDRQVIPDEPIQNIFEESEGLRGIQKNGKFGFVDSQGRLRIANRYEGIQKYSEGLAPAKIRGKWGYINHQDNIAIQPAYEEVFPFNDGYAQVKQKNLFGLINKKGQLLLPVRYESITPTKHGNLLIKQDNLLGLADGNGKVLIQPRYHFIEDAGNGYIIVARDGKYGVVTSQAISTIPLIFDSITFNPYDRFFLAMKKSSWVEMKTP